MAYNKAVIYGEFLDLYTYEKDYNPIGGKRRKIETSSNISELDTNSIADRKRQFKSRRRDNRIRANMAFRRLVLSNMGKSAPPLLVTTTYAKNQRNVRIGYKDFKAFIRAMRNTFGTDFRYISVPEFQKRGAIHFHTLFWGLPEDTHIRERQTRLVAKHWNHGFVDVFLTDGDDKLSSYLAKYLSKNYQDVRLFEQKSYVASRNILKPITESNALILYLEEVYGIDVDNPPFKDKRFMTQWLGAGRLRAYKIIPK